MGLTSKQLEQLSKICKAVSELEVYGDTFEDGGDDATLINTEIKVTTRNSGKELGVVKMGRIDFEFYQTTR